MPATPKPPRPPLHQTKTAKLKSRHRCCNTAEGSGNLASALGDKRWPTTSCEQAKGIVACDVLTVETLWLKGLRLLFFVHLSTRQVVVAVIPANPRLGLAAQQARDVVMDLQDREATIQVAAARPLHQVLLFL
jgi:hypothetical protein